MAVFLILELCSIVLHMCIYRCYNLELYTVLELCSFVVYHDKPTRLPSVAVGPAASKYNLVCRVAVFCKYNTDCYITDRKHDTVASCV